MGNTKTLSGQEIIDAIIKFNNDPEVQKLASFYSNQSVPEIFGVSRREVSHSAFLSWLFTTNANHGLGEKPLMQLLELYLKCCRDQNKVSTNSVQLEQIQTAILTRNISILSTDVHTEEAVATDKAKGRADIVIACDVHIPDNTVKKISIIIENKIYSKENKEQTQIYFNYHQGKKLEEEVCLYVYLTPPANKDAKCPAFVHLTYQDLLDSILEPLLVQSNLSDRTKFILTEYINNLSIPSDYIDEKNITKKARTIMAINTKERELLQSFWDKHLDLFITALTSIATDENSSVEDRKAASDIVKKVQKINNRKDYSKYSINGTGCYGKGVIPAETIRTYINDHQNISYEELVNLFPDKLQGSFGVIKRLQDVKEKDTERYRHTIEHNGETLRVCSEWEGGTGGNFPKFIQYVNGNKGLNITITKVEE